MGLTIYPITMLAGLCDKKGGRVVARKSHGFFAHL